MFGLHLLFLSSILSKDIMHGAVFRSLHCLCKRDLQNQLLGKSLLKGISPGAALEPGSVQTILVIVCRKGI